MTWVPRALAAVGGGIARLASAIPLPILPWYGWALGAGALGAGLLVASGAGGEAPPTRPSGAPPLVKAGSEGPWVAYLQALLGVAQTGTFDDETGAAVRALQTQRGLTADEIVGPATWGALGVSGSAAPKPSGGGTAAPQPSAPGPSSSDNPFGLADSIPEREAQILSYVEAGSYEHDWAPLTYQDKQGRTVSMLVSRAPFVLRDDAGNRLLVNATQPTAQAIADHLGGALMTTRVSDEIQKHADVKLPVRSKAWQGPGTDESGSKTFRMYDQSADILARIPPTGLVSNAGKDWVNTRRAFQPPEGTGTPATAHHASNFGWYPSASSSHSPGGMPVVQSIGETHGLTHTDYSQLLRYVKRDSITIDGAAYSWADALRDPSLSSAIQDEGGTIPSERHPDL